MLKEKIQNKHYHNEQQQQQQLYVKKDCNDMKDSAGGFNLS